jgi:hypothetical protein
LLITQIEANASEGRKSSGIGFLTLMADYKVKLGWEFGEVSGDSSAAKLSTLACLRVGKE